MKQLVKQFLALESAGGIFLFFAALLAMVWANSPLAYLHQELIDTFLFLINEGLMAVFFLLVGLELKRGLREGVLSNFGQIALPFISAIGGMVVPAYIFYLFNQHHPIMLNGWSIPIATDIAFAIGALSLFGKTVSPALKLFLLTLAIFDDIGAIIVITLFYTSHLSVLYLFLTVLMVLVLYFFNTYNVRQLFLYLIIGVLLWFCLLKSGIHPTLAGVILALFIPDYKRLEKILHPWVAFGIMPIFALANAGVSLQGWSFNMLTSSLILGIVFGLFLGKQIGVFGFARLSVMAGIAKLPKHATWLELYGIALFCGIGFTMSLFLGTLSFQGNDVYLSQVRVGVILGSLLSALIGMIILMIAMKRLSKRR